MTSEDQIVQKLNTIEQYNFELMVNNLLYQGAFHEIVDEHALIESFGINIEKRRTIKSRPRADAELTLKGIVIESSTQKDWRSKLKELLEKNKGRKINKFVFCTNQDTGTKEIKVDGKTLDAEKYCCESLRCESCFIIGQKAIVLPLQDPRFFYIRRNFLNIPDDFFYSATNYRSLLKNNDSLVCEVKNSEIERYSNILSDKLTFDPNYIVLLFNDDYITLLHTIGMFGYKRIASESQRVITIDLCFIRWPQRVVNFDNVSVTEINDHIPTVIFVWGAHNISNISEFLMFNKRNVMLVFVCQLVFKEKVLDELRNFRGHIQIQEIHIFEIDQRQVSVDEQEIHRRKIHCLVEDLTELSLMYEALIYLYSPFFLNDRERKKRVRKILGINQSQVDQLNNLLLNNDLASVTGRILWLKQPIVAKDLLKNYIEKNIFPIDNLME